MPALLDDPTSPVIYRASGAEPFPTAQDPQIPSSIFPRPITLRDRVTVATLVPFFSPSQVPPRLLSYLCETLNKEIEGGDTYPMINPLPIETFGPYWFGNFAAVMIRGDIGGIESVQEMEAAGTDWSKVCLGSFYVKPNYPGRSSHICNGGFLVTPAARNKGVGKSMGECYIDWAPQLGYTYSVFNLVYETNTASTRIWDSLGFKRIGRVPACGNLRSSSELVGALIYGRDLGSEGEGFVSEERFDKIRYYLKHSKYPTGADRAEKSRLRSAATHYKLVDGQEGAPEKLMLKDKEVISEPQSQYEIARDIHMQTHAGINKTTAVIATKYHWVRIKETVGQVIKNCPECKDSTKAPMGTRDNSEKSKKDDLGMSVPGSSSLVGDAQYANSQGHALGESPFNAKRGLFPGESHQSMHESLAHLGDYNPMSIDPQIMAQLTAQLDPPFQHPGNAYAQAGLPHFGRSTQIHPQTQEDDYHPADNDHYMSEATAAAVDHDESMDLLAASQLSNDGQIPQHLLQGSYSQRDDNSHFKQ